MGRPVLELLSLAAGYLDKKGVPAARREADAMLGQVLACDRLHLYLRFEEVPLEAEVARFREMTRRRGEREPLQYILGSVAFLGQRFQCDRRALIPRPETEDLARICQAWLAATGRERCADIGTGTGCLGLSLALGGAQVTLSDLSPEALELAQVNALALGLAEKVRFKLGDLWGAFDASEVFDLVVSNPPYVAAHEKPSLQPELSFEPQQALYAGPSGLEVLKPLIAGAPPRIASGGLLALECGLGQVSELMRFAQEQSAWSAIRAEKDGFGVERFLVCERA